MDPIENIDYYLQNRIDWHQRMMNYHEEKRDLALQRTNNPLSIEVEVHEDIIEQYKAVCTELQGMKDNLALIASTKQRDNKE